VKTYNIIVQYIFKKSMANFENHFRREGNISSDSNSILAMLEYFEQLENGTDGAINETAPMNLFKQERVPISSLVKLTSMKMEKMFWTMTMVASKYPLLSE